MVALAIEILITQDALLLEPQTAVETDGALVVRQDLARPNAESPRATCDQDG
jgi:hypothetical protein